MKLTQGTFSFLPELTDEEIRAQIEYCLSKGWALSVEFTDDPHPRNVYWNMWGLPMFDLADASGIIHEVNRAREAFPRHYIRLNAFDSSYGRQTTALSFLVQRPPNEEGFRLERQETSNRQIRYQLHPYSSDQPSGNRYGS